MTSKRGLRERIAELETQLRIEQDVAAFWKWLYEGGDELRRELDRATADSQ